MSETRLTTSTRGGLSSLKAKQKSMTLRNRENTPAEEPSEYFKRTITIPFLDHLLSQLEERFISDQQCGFILGSNHYEGNSTVV